MDSFFPIIITISLPMSFCTNSMALPLAYQVNGSNKFIIVFLVFVSVLASIHSSDKKMPLHIKKNISVTCAVWLHWISSLVTSAGHSLRLELLNRSEGDITTFIAGMDDTVSDDDFKEEIMRCFSNAPTMIQGIGVLRGIRQ